MSVVNPAAAARYKNVQVATCSPAQLVVLLYDGALRFTREAMVAMEARDRARAGERIGKAHAVLEELAATLDASQAPELCDNLGGLYAFCMQRLLVANLEQRTAVLDEVVEVLQPLRDAFAQIARGAPAGP